MSWWALLQIRSNDAQKRKRAIEKLYRSGKTRGTAPLITALKDSDESVRHRAAEALGRIGDHRAIEPLVVALKDPSSSVRVEAAEALGRIGDHRAIEPLVVALKDPSSSVRGVAARALKMFQYEPVDETQQALLFIARREWDNTIKLGLAAVEPLVVLLNGYDYQLRRDAAKALGNIGDARAVEPLIAALKDSDMNLRQDAAVALGMIGDDRAVGPLIAALGDVQFSMRDSRASRIALGDVQFGMRVRVVNALGEIGDIRAIEPLIAEFKYDFCNDIAMKALVKLGSVVIEPLINALKDPDVSVRQYTARTLGKISDPRAIEPLIGMLKDSRSSVRNEVAQALEDMQYDPVDETQQALLFVARREWDNAMSLGAAAVDPLIASLADFEVNKVAVESLVKIGEVAISPLIVALKDSDSTVRSYAAQALGKIGDARAVDPMIAALEDSHCYVGDIAAEFLGMIGDARSVEPLIASLKHDSYGRPRLEALVKIGPAAVERLIVALKDSDISIRQNAAEALGKIGDARAIEPLIDSLKDSDISVRQKAAEILGNIGDARAIEPLIDSLKVELLILALHYHHDISVRQKAAEALGKMGDAQAIELLIASPIDNSYGCYQTEALVKIGTAAVERLLIVALKDSDNSMSDKAAEALGKISDVLAVDPLVAVLTGLAAEPNKSNWFVRGSVIKALAKTGDVRAIVPIVNTLLYHRGLGDKDIKYKEVWSALEAIDPVQKGKEHAVPLLVKAFIECDHRKDAMEMLDLFYPGWEKTEDIQKSSAKLLTELVTKSDSPLPSYRFLSLSEWWSGWWNSCPSLLNVLGRINPTWEGAEVTQEAVTNFVTAMVHGRYENKEVEWIIHFLDKIDPEWGNSEILHVALAESLESYNNVPCREKYHYLWDIERIISSFAKQLHLTELKSIASLRGCYEKVWKESTAVFPEEPNGYTVEHRVDCSQAQKLALIEMKHRELGN